MSKTAKDTAIEILKTNDIGVMATNNNGIPNSRYMTFAYIDSMIYTLAKKDAAVVKEIKLNPTTHILLGYESDGLLETFLEIEGNAATTIHDIVKQQLLKKYPVSSASEDFVVIQVTPTRMRIMNKDGKNQEEIHLF